MTLATRSTRLLLAPLLLATALALSGCGLKKNVLYVYTWSDYIDPQLVAAFEKQYACTVKIDTFDTNEAMYAKLRAGGGGYDVIFPSTFFIKMLADNKMIQPLNHDLLPNVAANFDKRFRDKIYDGSLTYTVPYTVFYTGLAYRKDKTPGLAPSWNLYMDPQFKGRSTLIGDMHMTIGAALKTLGFSLNSTNVVELEQARDLVIKWKANIARFENEAYKTGLASSEFLLCMAYSGDIVQVQEEAPQVTFIYPKEGYPCSCDEMAIPSTAKSVELAHRFINFIYDGEWAAKNICYTGFCSPVTPAYGKIPDKYRNNTAIFPSDEDLARAEVMRYLGDATPLYTRIWDEIKAHE
jgi:spermidine/putrescine transport system substrate-binding protein